MRYEILDAPTRATLVASLNATSKDGWRAVGNHICAVIPQLADHNGPCPPLTRYEVLIAKEER